MCINIKNQIDFLTKLKFKTTAIDLYHGIKYIFLSGTDLLDAFYKKLTKTISPFHVYMLS